MTSQWIVERWGGQLRHKAHVVFIGSQDLAEAKYSKIAKTMRQGELRLLDGDRQVAWRKCAWRGGPVPRRW